MMRVGAVRGKPAPAMEADRPALLRLFGECSFDTIVGRFFAPLREFPRAYLGGALAMAPREHDATVIRYGDGLHVAGLASFVRLNSTEGEAGELAVLVGDRWQHQGLGTVMASHLVARAAARGVEEMHASVLPGRHVLLERLTSLAALCAITSEADCVTGRFRLDDAAMGCH